MQSTFGWREVANERENAQAEQFLFDKTVRISYSQDSTHFDWRGQRISI